MVAKKVKIISIISIIISIMLLMFIFRLHIKSMYLSTKYKGHVNMLKEYLAIVSSGNKSDIAAVTAQDSRILSPRLITVYSSMLTNVDIDTLKIINIYSLKISDNNTIIASDIDTLTLKERLSIQVYFDNKINKRLNISLRFQNNKWKVDMISIADDCTNQGGWIIPPEDPSNDVDVVL